MIKKYISDSEFARNVITLMTGTTIAQAIPIAISPILTRIYSPEDFGVLALFISISAIFGSIATARYELAIMLPEKNEEAINITALCIIISFFLSSVLFLIVSVFHVKIVELIGSQSISRWLYFIPLIVLFIGIHNALSYYNTRNKYFKNIASANVSKSLALVVLQLSVRIVKSGAYGLITGQIFSYFIASLVLVKKLKKNRELIRAINFAETKRLAIRYIKFPKFSMWAVLANTLSINLIDIFISYFYSVATLGFYSLVNRVLGIPASLLGANIGKVFFQKATEEKRKYGNATRAFNSTLRNLLIIAIPSFTILFFVVEDAFVFIFGEQWRVAGEYSKYLIFFYFVRFVMSPLSVINSIFEKQIISLAWQLGLLIIVLTLFYISFAFNLTIFSFLLLFAITLSTYYFIMIPILYYVAKGK